MTEAATIRPDEERHAQDGTIRATNQIISRVPQVNATPYQPLDRSPAGKIRATLSDRRRDEQQWSGFNL